jgi:hypothetical protein
MAALSLNMTAERYAVRKGIKEIADIGAALLRCSSAGGVS